MKNSSPIDSESLRPKAGNLGIVIPMYNEQDVFPELISRLHLLIQQAYKDNLGISSTTVLFVDDGSTDATWRLITETSTADVNFKGIRLSRNFGHQTAVSAGLDSCRDFDAVAVLDADLQDPPEVILDFIRKHSEGYLVVYGIRKNRKEGFGKRFCYWLFYRLLSRASETQIPVDSGDFCLMDKRVVSVINSMPERSRFIRGLRAWVGFRQVGVEYERASRESGQSKYSFRRLFDLASDGIFNFSGIPLRLATVMGFCVAFLSLVGATFTFLQRIFAEWFATIGLAPVPGFATIVISILFLGGVQLIFIGILGEYLIRIFEEVKRRPQWVLEDSIGFTEE